MCTIHVRKLLVAFLLLGGMTLVGMGVARAPAQSSPDTPLPQIAPLEAHTAITPTHPYTPTLQFITAAGGEGGDILASPGYAFVGDGAQLAIFDVSNPSAPQRVKRFGLRGAVCQMELVGSLLYVAARFGGIRIYEVSNPAQPRLLGAVADGRTTCPFTVAGGMAYAFEWFKVWAIDVSNPAAPFLRGSVDLQNGNYPYDGIFTAGNIVFVSSSVVNASDPDNLQLTLSIDGAWVAVQDDLAIVDNVECPKGCYGGLVFYDISDPANPQPNGEYPSGVPVDFIQVYGDLLIYSSSSQTTLLDIDQPDAPVYLSTIEGGALEKDGDLLYVAGDPYAAYPIGAGSINVMDIGKPTKPELVGSYATPNSILGYARSGEMVFLRTVVPNKDHHELQVVDVTYPSDPYLIGRSYSMDLFSVSEALVQGERAYVLSNLFHVVDYRNASAPQIMGSYKVDDLFVYNLNVVGDYAYLSGHGQIKILDVREPTQPVLAQTYGGNPGEPGYVSSAEILDNGMGYLVAYDENTFDYDLQVMQFNPPAPPVVYSIYEGLVDDEIFYGEITDLDGDGQRVYLSYWNGAVEQLDTSNPYSPTLTGYYSSTMWAYLLRQAGDVVLLGRENNVSIVDFSNPLSPTLASTIELPMSAADIQVEGGWAYISNSYYWMAEGMVYVYDIHDPYHPTLLSTYASPANHIQIDGGLAYMSAEKDGLQVVGLWEPSVFLPQILMHSP